MKILLIFFTFYLISGALKDIDVTGYSGGSVLVDAGGVLPNNKQYVQKQTHDKWIIIIDNKQNQWVNKGRFTLYLNKNSNIMLFIRELNSQDSGRYKIWLSGSEVIEIHLNVIDDSCCEVSQRVMVNIGENITFSCEYSQKHINNAKIIFKEGKDSIDQVIHSTWNKNERFSLSDRRDQQLIIVRITAVTPDDGGVYLCGVWIHRHPYSYFTITTVHLYFMDFSMIIIISVCVILLLIGGFTLTVWKLKHERRDPGSAQMNSNDDLPTIPSDGLLYAAVSFQKHEESLSDATVRFNKNEIHSDYTTISQRMRLN